MKKSALPTGESSALAPPAGARGRSARALVAAVFVLMAARLLLLVARNQVNLLFADEWDLYRLFMRGAQWRELFLYQPGPHRQGAGYILMSWIAAASDWNTRVMSFTVVGFMIAAAALALLLKRRLWGTLAAADVIIPLLFLSPIQYEDFLGPANLPTTSLPIFLILLYALSWTLADRTWRYACVLALNLLLIYCGYGFFMGLVTPALVALDLRQAVRRRQGGYAPALALVIALASLALFFVDYHPYPGCFQFSARALLNCLWFMALMFSNLLRLKGHGILPTLVGLALIALALRLGFRPPAPPAGTASERDRSRNFSRIIAALAGFSLLYSASAAYGRECFGVDYGQSSRYMPYLFPAFLAFYFAALSLSPARRRAATLWIYAAALVIAAVFMAPRDRRTIAYYHQGKLAWRECYLAAHDVAACTRQSRFQIYPEPGLPRVRRELDYMQRNHLNLFSGKQSGGQLGNGSQQRSQP